MRAGRAPDLHGLVVMRDGQIVAEHYRSGQDWKWNEPLGVVDFGPETLHDIRSISKSVTSLLYGIALGRGHVPAPDEHLLPQFAAYAEAAADPAKQRLTVRHALTMSLGIEWNEDAPYTSTANSEIAMEFAPDRYQYVLRQPMVEEPGQRWHYCGGATALLGKLIADGTGQPLQDFARDTLFGPLGIAAFEWMVGADGVASPASGLRLAAPSLARIGQLVLQQGRWDGRELVPAAWLDEALRTQLVIEPGFDYGYQWYLGTIDEEAGPRAPVAWVGGIGNGGQRLFVLPELATVLAIAGGSYDSADQSSTASAILEAVLA
jgi:CubicO group peptidase (beta-lactamase class C family)